MGGDDNGKRKKKIFFILSPLKIYFLQKSGSDLTRLSVTHLQSIGSFACVGVAAHTVDPQNRTFFEHISLVTLAQLTAHSLYLERAARGPPPRRLARAASPFHSRKPLWARTTAPSLPPSSLCICACFAAPFHSRKTLWALTTATSLTPVSLSLCVLRSTIS